MGDNYEVFRHIVLAFGLKTEFSAIQTCMTRMNLVCLRNSALTTMQTSKTFEAVPM